MEKKKVYRAIGLMSGTVLDGEIDVALLETDGDDYVNVLGFYAHPYDVNVREAVRKCFGRIAPDGDTKLAETLVTDAHIEAVKASGFEADVIGFHGQTITHLPDQGFTWQLGDGAKLARETGIRVVNDMRSNDMKYGGEGAPLLPLYHAARLKAHHSNAAVLNLGGVSNITYVGEDDELIAFDCGPANALMDDYMRTHFDKDFDEGGAVALSGLVSQSVLDEFDASSYFKKPAPKSLDRNHWTLDIVKDLSSEDAMATLLAMGVWAVVYALEILPAKPKAIYACGGGRKNGALMAALARACGNVHEVEDLGWNGDATEAEGFAYLAVRSLLGLPLSVPSTTGVDQPVSGGVHHNP
ncbi:MAG: anhydro-N-acetylmuramic acid kinase [Micavibrio sp.]|nr:anhydro-N-acetylmuramic acid kinase [Micavibrio sp.]